MSLTQNWPVQLVLLTQWKMWGWKNPSLFVEMPFW